MKLNSIEIHNFKSFQGTHSFEFPETSGVYFLTGKNKVDDLESNGAGKSTFLDAIVWCLYGRTSRGLKAADVHPWGSAGNTYVALDVTIGYRFVVKRSQRPNGLWIDDKPVDQEELQKHIRLNFDSFLHSVMNAQFGESFFSLSPTAKLSLFSNIMELDFWLEKSEKAAVASKGLFEQASEVRKLISREEGQAEMIESDIEKFRAEEQEFENKIKTELAVIRAELKNLKKKKLSWGDLAYEVTEKKVNALKRIKKGMQQQEVNDKELDLIIKKMQENSKQLAIAKNTYDSVVAEIDRLNAIDGTDCPTCGARFNSRQHNKHILEMTAKFNRVDHNKKWLTTNYETNKKDLMKVRNEIQVCDSRLEAARNDLHEANLKLKEIELSEETSQRQHTKLVAELEKKETEVNPYSDLIASKKKTLKTTKNHLLELTDKVERLDAEYEATSFWIKGFKRVRLFIIEQTFRTLELEVNNSLAQLGLPDWQISFDVERENKSGGLTKGFMVFVKSPKNTEPVKWESWSGGETQRLALAGDLGLSNLICQQAGLTNTVEFYDEPSTHMSQKGVTDLAHMLHERAVTEGKTIWIVDHVALTNFGDLQDTIVVEKTGHGSAIKRS